MKLFRFFTVAVMVLLAGIGASAQDTAKEDVRIYINPGHGSWGPNNRHMATIGHSPISSENPDTTDFFESNTNLRKGLALLERLHEYGIPFDKTKNQTNSNPNRIGAALDLTQNLVMSHVKCGPFPYEEVNGVDPDQKNDFNRTLSVIAEEVEENDFDMFISIHSNAATDGNTVNYLYFAYDNIYWVSGKEPTADNADASAQHFALSREMSRCGWNHRILDRHTQWTHYDYTMTKDDLAAGKGKIGWQNLGVLNHSVPGYLVEGYFHTYQPARHRYMNFDVCRIEGVDYARGVADYFGWGKESTGDIYGVVRDKHEKFSHDLYSPNAATLDKYKPLNDVVVILKKNGEQVATDTTDVNYNGVFVFRNLEPGDYTVEFLHPDYKEGLVWTTEKATEEAAPALSVSVNAATTAYPTVFLQNVNYVPPTVTYVNYPDSTANLSIGLAEEINFSAEYTNNAVLEGKKIRRTIVRDSYMYVLAFDENNAPTVCVFDTDTKELIKTLGTAAASGDIYALSDIALTADGYLVGINKANQAYGGSNCVKAYKWDNGEDGIPDGEAKEWWSNNFAGNWTNGIAGESLTYSGTIEDGKFIYTGATTGTSGSTRLVIVSISEGNYLGYMRNNQDGIYMTTTYYGETYSITISPNADDQLIVNSEIVQPFEIKLNTADAGAPTILAALGENALNVKAAQESYFKYAGRSLMVTPSITAESKVDGVKLFDITDGLDNAVEIVLNGASIDATDFTSASANGELALTIDDLSGKTTDADLELFLNVDGKISKFITAGVKQPVNRGVYAYNLAVASNDKESATVTFNLSDKSNNVDIILTPADGGEEIVYNAGALAAGENSYTVDLNGLDGKYNWSVSVANKSIANGDILATVNTWGASASKYYRGGVASECNPESDFFGTTYLSVGRSNGIYTINPTFAVETGAPYWANQFNANNASSTFRGTLYNGKFYVTDWSDAYPGIWIFDPANPTAINNIFAGATNDGTGKLSIDGVAVGGGSTGVAFTREGADRKMFIYVEDLPDGNAGNKIYRYDIGENDTWGAVAPVQFADASKYLANTNTGMLGSALHNVVFCSQTRYSGSNAAGVPSFIVIDEEGNVVFNSADLADTLDGCQGGGMALSYDETRFAVNGGDQNSAIRIYDVEWTDDVPSFTYVTSIPTNDQEICQMSFDYAGNLHCINRKHGYYVHSVPNVARDVVTPAKAALVITAGDGSSVDAIETVAAKVIGGNGEIVIVGEAENVSVYNVSGQAIVVNAAVTSVEVPAGIYVVVVDGKATKVAVK